MKSKIFLIAISAMTLVHAGAENRKSWLPDKQNTRNAIRLLECMYDKARLERCEEITPASSDWEVRLTGDPDGHTSPYGTEYVYEYTFKAKRALQSAGVAVAFDRYNWSSDNYVMIPSVVYNGNRQRIVNRQYATGLDETDYKRPDLALTSNPIPQLSPEFGAPSRLEVLVNNAATPAIAWLERAQQKGYILLTDQGIEKDGAIYDHALIVEETPDRSVSSLVVSAPGVREKRLEFIGFSESRDRGLAFRKGEEVKVRIRLFAFDAPAVPVVLDRFHQVRKLQTGENSPRNLKPASEVMRLMTSNIDRRYMKCDGWEFYRPENADWISFGWIGGMMNTYPMLALGDPEHLQKVKNTFDFGLRGQGKAGYFHDLLNSDGKVLGGLRSKPEISLVRKNADMLYWMLKQFMLLKVQNKADEINPEWEKSIMRLADAFVNTWNKHGELGNYINVETGEVEVCNSTSGVMAVAGLALASEYYGKQEYLNIAEQIGDAYYKKYSLVGFTSGGCGDILQNADSETSIAFLTSCNLLYELTRKSVWLKRAQDAANLCATWVISFDYVLPENTELAQVDGRLTGAVWASTQNKHSAPGFCTSSADALFRVFRETEDVRYAELLHDVWHGYVEGITPNGFICERLGYCDVELRGTRLNGDGGNGWTELNGCMMAMELPGIYIRTDKNMFYAFDHVDVKLIKGNEREMLLSITNTTPFDAEISVLSESEAEVVKPLSSVAFVNWKKIKVKAGKTIEYRIKK
ncbi:glycoside hydrolase family 76 protein [uncultured Parabacteroides sp.]|jgi:hypothetical protein|uniref:glycoside hydrolase family 76 protein n=1 Tax=uncultured Parabacteroides sp. TaxID=512312 RepID=UPI0025D9D96D|nr:glycoside hydrolase family 76 protein [uncultured Parabacteroides sp.]